MATRGSKTQAVARRVELALERLAAKQDQVKALEVAVGADATMLTVVRMIRAQLATLDDPARERVIAFILGNLQDGGEGGDHGKDG